MVGKVGLEPTVYLTSRIYSPLQSPLCLLAHICGLLPERYKSLKQVTSPEIFRSMAAGTARCPDRLDESAIGIRGGSRTLSVPVLSRVCLPFHHTDIYNRNGT